MLVGGVGETDEGEIGKEVPAELVEERSGIGTGEDELTRVPEGGHPGATHLGQCQRLLVQPRSKGFESIVSHIGKLRFAGVLGQAKECPDGEGIAGGFCAVIVFLEPEDEITGGGGREEASLFAVFKEFDHAEGVLQGMAKQGHVEGGFVEIDQGIDECGIVVEEGIDGGFVLPPAAVEVAGLGIGHFFENEYGCAAGGLGVAGFVEDAGSEGEGGDHEGVPAAQDLVIEVGAGAPVTGVEEDPLAFLESGLRAGDGELTGGFFP